MNSQTASKHQAPNDCHRKYYGKFRGSVVNNVDPKGLGRLQVIVSEVMAAPLATWATMCTPVGGVQHGMFSVPPLNAGVFIEFENGDIDHPVWTGCFLGSGLDTPKQAPTANPVTQSITLQTPLQSCLIIDDAPGLGGTQLKFRTGATITITDKGIELNNMAGASITMMGPTIQIKAKLVSINGTNLTIME